MNAARDYFEQAAAEYEQRSGSGIWRWIRACEARAILAALHPLPGERILDAGSGAGHYSALLKNAGARVTALDFSPSMLAKAESSLGIATILGDLATVELRPEFDKVLCAGALEFVDDPRAAVANLCRALDPQGPCRLVLFLPRPCLWASLYRRFHRSHGVKVRLFPEPDVLAISTAMPGFSIASRRRVFFNEVIVIESRP